LQRELKGSLVRDHECKIAAWVVLVCEQYLSKVAEHELTLKIGLAPVPALEGYVLGLKGDTKMLLE
jgi:hypothetical protein